MTEDQKIQVKNLRAAGLGYGAVAKTTGLSPGTVKSFCRRNNLAGYASKSQGVVSLCEYCGREVHQVEGRKHKRFCCDTCRSKWWNAHRDQLHRSALRTLTCPTCGKAFEVYGNAPRKYCCHACYISARFGGNGNEQ